MNDDFVPAHPQEPGLDPAQEAKAHADAILKVEDVSKIYRSGDTEVHALYGEGWQIELLGEYEVQDKNWRFVERGMSRLHERVYRLTRR